MTNYKIYSISDYSKVNSVFIKNNAINLTKTKLKHLLTKENNNYHFRIQKNTDYVLFGDLDNFSYNFEKFIEIFIKFLKEKYNLDILKDDIMYTQNDSKSGSFHYSIPKYYGKTETLKILHNNFQKYYIEKLENVNKSNIDTTIYSEHWYRCPNQGKGSGSGTDKHIIKKGNMIDFIIDYIPIKSICIDNVVNNHINNEKLVNNNNKIVKQKNTNNEKNEIVEIESKAYILEKQNKHNENVLSTAISKPIICKRIFDDCYKPERFDEYNTWITVGMAIKNTFIDENTAFDLFNYFSSKGSKYEGIENARCKYATFVKKEKSDGYTIATIYHIAIEDNKAKFVEIMGRNTLELGPTDICMFLKNIAGYKFIYIKRGEKYLLFCYNGKYWINDDVLIKQCISTELYSFLKTILVEVYWSSLQFKNLKSKVDKLKTITFKKEIIETYKEYGTVENIEFDTKWWLLGFNNKVYDLQEGYMRNYLYDDYVSITTGYDWREPTQKELDTMNYIIKTIMPIEEEREFYLQLLSTTLEGKALEKFIVFNGNGGNGKGMIDDMLLLALGDYAIIGNNAILFEFSKTGTNPEKANIHKKRLVIFREPSERKKFENSVIKELTGGGTISARGLYESNAKKELNLTLIVECNKRPLFAEEPGDAEVRRLIDINFRSSFVNNEDLIDEENYIFKANSDYKTEYFQNKHKYALMQILMNAYTRYRNNGSTLQMPDSIKKRTEQYLEMSCNLLQWFKDNYELSETDTIAFKDMFDLFKQSDFYINANKIEKRNFTKNKFYEYFQRNIFTRKYYKERYNNLRNILNCWKQKTHLDDV